MPPSSPLIKTPLAVFGRALRRGRLAHAYALCGPSASVREEVALAMAQILLCEDLDLTSQPPASCGACRGCSRTEHRTHPDFLFVEPDGAMIRVNQARDICRSLMYSPLEASRRVIVIRDAHLMNPEAANTLLKTLEEPGEGNVFLLTAPSADFLLPTIASRCQTLRCPAPEKEPEEGTRKEVRDLVLGLLGYSRPRGIAEALAAAHRLAETPETTEDVIRALKGLVRDLLLSGLKDRLVSTSAHPCRARTLAFVFSPGADEEALRGMLDRICPDDLTAYGAWLEEAEHALGKNINREILLSAAFLPWVTGKFPETLRN